MILSFSVLDDYTDSDFIYSPSKYYSISPTNLSEQNGIHAYIGEYNISVSTRRYPNTCQRCFSWIRLLSYVELKSILNGKKTCRLFICMNPSDCDRLGSPREVFLSPTVMYRRCSGYIKLVFLYFCQ